METQMMLNRVQHFCNIWSNLNNYSVEYFCQIGETHSTARLKVSLFKDFSSK